jgi:hypothetical protein
VEQRRTEDIESRLRLRRPRPIVMAAGNKHFSEFQFPYCIGIRAGSAALGTPPFKRRGANVGRRPQAARVLTPSLTQAKNPDPGKESSPAADTAPRLAAHPSRGACIVRRWARDDEVGGTQRPCRCDEARHGSDRRSARWPSIVKATLIQWASFLIGQKKNNKRRDGQATPSVRSAPSQRPAKGPLGAGAPVSRRTPQGCRRRHAGGIGTRHESASWASTRRRHSRRGGSPSPCGAPALSLAILIISACFGHHEQQRLLRPSSTPALAAGKYAAR